MVVFFAVPWLPREFDAVGLILSNARGLMSASSKARLSGAGGVLNGVCSTGTSLRISISAPPESVFGDLFLA